MVKIFYGEKGTGKTKLMLENANRTAGESSGDVVFIDDGKQLILSLNRNIRFIDVGEFPVKGENRLFGFICGILAQDYDINAIFIDGLTSIINTKPAELEGFFKEVEAISGSFNIDFYISISSKLEEIPGFMKTYLA